MSLEVKGKIGKEDHSIIDDTGASKSIIQPQVIRNNKIKNSSKYMLRTATGELVQ